MHQCKQLSAQHFGLTYNLLGFKGFRQFYFFGSSTPELLLSLLFIHSPSIYNISGSPLKMRFYLYQSSVLTFAGILTLPFDTYASVSLHDPFKSSKLASHRRLLPIIFQVLLEVDGQLLYAHLGQYFLKISPQ